MQILITLVVSTILTLVNPIVKESAVNTKKNITVTVMNVTSNKGKVTFALFNKENFLRIPLQGKSSEIKEGKSTIVFEDVPVGEYAITCYHDENENNKMDFSLKGMPIEDYGASNNVMRFGPPQYYDAKFIVSDKDVSLEIKF